MSETWLPDVTGIVCDDQVGDDDQVGKSYSVRFHRTDRPGAIITWTAYPVSASGDCDGPFLVRIEIEWLVGRVPEDPGGTEVWSESFKDYVTGSYGSAAEAEGAARNAASELLRDAGTLTWDGLPQPEGGDS